MKNILKRTLVATCLAAAILGTVIAVITKGTPPGSHVHASTPTSTKLLTYWLSWAQGNSSYQYPNLSDVPEDVDIVLIALAVEKPDHTGLMLQSKNQDRLIKDIAELHNRHKKIKVLLSSGGAAAGYPWKASATGYPWEDAALTDEQVAQQFEDFGKKLGTDGIDFDIEAGEAKRLGHIVHLIKEKKPEIIVTATFAIDSTGINRIYLPVAKQLFGDEGADLLNGMNYDQYWKPDTCSYEEFGSDTCYLRNIQVVVQQMQKFTQLPADQARQKVVVGLMFGTTDDGQVVDLGLIKKLATYSKEQGYGGVMTWDLNRDQPGQDIASSTGLTAEATKEFTNAVIEVLK